MALARTLLPFIVSSIVLHYLEASKCEDDSDATCAAKKALSHDEHSDVEIAIELFQKKSAINELKDSRRIVHGMDTAEAEAKEHVSLKAAVASNVSEAEAKLHDMHMASAATHASHSAATNASQVAASINNHDEGTPAVQLLPRYAKCWDMGWDQESRDAICLGDLKCARKDFDDRNFGDCSGEHCCSKEDLVFKALKEWMGNIYFFVAMLFAIVWLGDPAVRNMCCGCKK
mmetsp:Transcript_167631/g.321937  ORF Transcript_167631/g.321937 Transcript_167631/m.321937 type:complete len:231 (+) Transcript_167631:64-756(+)